MAEISEFDAAVLVKMSPELLRWLTSYAPKKDKLKLSYKEKNGVYFYDKDELEKFNRNLNTPWPKPPKGERPSIPLGIQQEIKKEAYHVCPVCHTNIGEIAHIEAVSTSLNNHPHNLIYLCPNHHTVYDYGFKYRNLTKDEVLTYKKALLIFQIGIWRLRGTLINSYLSAINLVGRVKSFEADIIKAIPDKEFETFFELVLSKVETCHF